MKRLKYSNMKSTGEKRKIRIHGFKYAVIPKGCQVYEQDGFIIFALNEENAKRKFEKIRKAK